MRRTLHGALSAALFLAGCGEEEPDTGAAVHDEPVYTVSVESDIVYAKALGFLPQAPESLTELSPLLDVYYPSDRSEIRPVFLWIHGGGFTGGSKTRDEIEEMAAFFAARGWVFVSINYRTTEVLGDGFELCAVENGPEYEAAVEVYRGIAPPEWTRMSCEGASDGTEFHQSIAMYAAQRDAKAALRWIVANSATYKMDVNAITVGGNSAGAITTAALGITDEDDFRDEIPAADDPTLATTNLSQTYTVQSLVWFWGARTKLMLFENVYEEDPYDASDPPIFLAHGTAEKPGESLTPYTESLELQATYDRLGIDSELVLLDCEVDPNCPSEEGWGYGAWEATVDGVSLSQLVFDFIVETQGLPVD